MTAIGEAVQNIPLAWRALATIASVLGVGFTGGVWFITTAADLKGLPPRMQAIEVSDSTQSAAIAELKNADQRIDAKLSRVLCFAESQAEIRPVSECIR